MTVYRSAMGKSVDMGAMTTKNEKTRAVGNMGVNGRGDLLDSKNKVVKQGSDRVRANYKKAVQSNSNLFPDDVDTPDLSAEEMAFEQDDEIESQEIGKDDKKAKRK